MALATQPNGSTIVPLAGAPRTTNVSYTVTTQTQNTVVQNSTGTVATAAVEAETIKVINN